MMIAFIFPPVMLLVPRCRCFIALAKWHLLLLTGMHWWRSYSELMSLLNTDENRFMQWPVETTLFLILTVPRQPQLDRLA